MRKLTRLMIIQIILLFSFLNELNAAEIPRANLDEAERYFIPDP